MNIREEQLGSWAKGPGQTEQDRCDNAVRAVKKAIAASDELKALDITVFPQGSYAARTNVRQDSDVDVCVRYNSAFFADYPDGKGHADFGNQDGDLSYSDFKDMVGRALTSHFGAAGVTRGNKAFDVHENTYRIDADVVAVFEHRRYTGRVDYYGRHDFLKGVAFYPDRGSMIINWPEQTLNNGNIRHLNTTRRYKKIIRILKRLRNEMQEAKVKEADNVASFLIECLVWNANTQAFRRPTYTDMLRDVIVDVYENTKGDDSCTEWGEVNELKYLFRSSQPWSRQQANDFIVAAWNYMGYQ